MTPLIINIEAVSLLLTGFMIFVTGHRKGKNRTLQIMAWFFIAGGLFRLGMYLSNLFPYLPDWSIATLIFSNACLYFGTAAYIGIQFGFLWGRKAAAVAYIIGFISAAALTGYHLFGFAQSFSLENPWVGNQLNAMLGMIALGFVFIVGLFVAFYVQARKQKISLSSNSTLNLGLGLMLVSWMLQKILLVEVGSLMAIILSALPFVAIIMIIVAIFLQTSSSMTPGVVYSVQTKHPVPLAIVRVFRMSDQKLLESRVTDENGRYGMLVGPGEYTIEVLAPNFQFPTSQPIGYRGQVIKKSKPAVLGFDIFLDPTI